MVITIKDKQHWLWQAVDQHGYVWTYSYKGKTKTEARMAMFTWIENWYNPHRRHSALNYLLPNNFQRKHTQKIIDTESQLIPELQ